MSASRVRIQLLVGSCRQRGALVTASQNHSASAKLDSLARSAYFSSPVILLTEHSAAATTYRVPCLLMLSGLYRGVGSSSLSLRSMLASGSCHTRNVEWGSEHS